MLCDNVDCQSKNPKDIKKVMLIKDEFGGEECFWCKDCRERDNEMIKK